MQDGTIRVLFYRKKRSSSCRMKWPLSSRKYRYTQMLRPQVSRSIGPLGRSTSGRVACGGRSMFLSSTHGSMSTALPITRLRYYLMCYPFEETSTTSRLFSDLEWSRIIPPPSSTTINQLVDGMSRSTCAVLYIEIGNKLTVPEVCWVGFFGGDSVYYSVISS